MREDLENYASLVIKNGVNLQKGQCLYISGSIENYDFMQLLSIKAYECGAKFVLIDPIDFKILKARFNNSNEEDLKFIPQFKTQMREEFIDKKWARIRVDNTENFKDLESLDSKKYSIYQKTLRELNKRVAEKTMNNELSWCVVCAPGPKWSAKVLKREESEETLKSFFNIQKKILRLENGKWEDNWREHNKKIHLLSQRINNLNIEKLIFKSEKTNLEIGLLKTSKWVGGSELVKGSKIEFNPNIPSEEVFTTPNFRKTNGIVYVTKPAIVLGKVIEKVWFEFKDGAVINFGCNSKTNEEILREFLNTDSQAKYLGEVALVDITSPINESNLTFYSILYDENATSHIALGAAYPSCLSNERELKSEEDKLNYGCNVSLVHTDFMIGSDEIDVEGLSFDGKKYSIIKNGKFNI